MRITRLLLFLTSLLVPVSAHAAIIDIASGLLTIPGGGLTSGPGGWTQATLSYDVNFDTSDSHYIYTYTFDGIVPTKEISHIITQVSDNFTTADMLTGTTAGGALDVYSATTQGGSNPGMPFAIPGIKWNVGGDALTYTWTIETLRAPMWGNIYVIDGKTPGSEVWSINSGFGANPFDPSGCYKDLYFTTPSCSGFALVPDTVTRPPDEELNPAPEPASIALMGTGLTAIALRLRRRRAAKRSEKV